MALIDEVQSRLSTQRQVELTNPESPSSKTVNTARLALACTDAMNEFTMRTLTTYDQTNSAHNSVGWIGVVAHLYKYRGLANVAPGATWVQDWHDALKQYARNGGGIPWLSPATNSNLTPTREVSGTIPTFDSSRMGDLVPRSPNSSPSLDGRY